MNANLTLLKKGVLLVSIPLAFQLLFLGLVLATQAEVADAQRWAIHTKEVFAKIEELYRRLTEGATAIRSLALSGDVDRYAVLEGELHKAPRTAAELEELVKDNKEGQSGRAAAIAAEAKALVARQDETARLFREGRKDEAVARLKDPAEPAGLDAFRETLAAFRANEDKFDGDRVARLRRTTQAQLAAMVLGGGLSAAGSVVLLVVFARGIGRRFAVLTENARRLAEGQELAAPILGRDELAQVDRVFHAMARSLDEKNRENELFIYSVSHDLRSPLVNLQGFSQELGYASQELRGLLQAEPVPEPIRLRGTSVIDRDVADSIRFIQTAVSRLSVIIDALLRLSRAGRVEYRYQPVDVAATVRRVVDALGTSIAERHAEVATGPLPTAWGDPTAVEQVFANLLGNAVNYLDPKRAGVVEIGALEAGGPSNPRGHVTYYVRDNGMGIPEAGMSKMFMAFQRFHDGRARGEGIGLALVRKIVERHGGKIWVESTPGVGSTFFVDLPVPPRDGQAPTPPTPREVALA